MRRMLDVDIPEKRSRGRPNLRWKDACTRDIYNNGRNGSYDRGGVERGQRKKRQNGGRS